MHILTGNEPKPALLTETSPPERPIEEDHQHSKTIEMHPMIKYAAAFGEHELHIAGQSGVSKVKHAGIAQVRWCRQADPVPMSAHADEHSCCSPEHSSTHSIWLRP